MKEEIHAAEDYNALGLTTHLLEARDIAPRRPLKIYGYYEIFSN